MRKQKNKKEKEPRDLKFWYKKVKQFVPDIEYDQKETVRRKGKEYIGVNARILLEEIYDDLFS